MNLRKTIGSWISGKAPAAASLPQIIHPAAMDRWQSSTLSTWTPTTIESTIRGALSGNLVAVWGLYDLMEATWPRLQKDLIELKDSVASADWQAQAWALRGMDPTPEAQRRAQLLDQALFSMRPQTQKDENDFRGTIKDVLDAWGKGIALVEVYWEVRDGLVAPRATQWVHPKYYGYPMDSAELQLNLGEITRGKSQISNLKSQISQWGPIPADQFLVGIAKGKSGHPIGSNLLRALAWWWCASNFSAAWLLNLAQLFGLPIRWANYDPNVPGLLAQVSDMLENMGSSAWAAFPEGTTLNLLEGTKTGAGSSPQESMLDRADKQCDLLILGQTLTSQEGKTGSLALGEEHGRILTGRKKAAADWTAGVLHQLARAFCRLNWGDERECPWLQPAMPAAQTDPKAEAERDAILLQAGIELPKAWAYERHKIPMPKAGEETLAKPEPPQIPMGPTDEESRKQEAERNEVQAKTAQLDARAAAASERDRETRLRLLLMDHRNAMLGVIRRVLDRNAELQAKRPEPAPDPLPPLIVQQGNQKLRPKKLQVIRDEHERAKTFRMEFEAPEPVVLAVERNEQGRICGLTTPHSK